MNIPFDLIIRNARCATASDVFTSDIGIKNGVITDLGQNLSGSGDEIDANGSWVTPGGVDGHCHFDEPVKENGIKMADDFLSATRSAACGGTTTVIPFTLQQRGQTLRDAINYSQYKAASNAFIDYAFHIIITDVNEQVLKEIPELINEGYTSFKIYMTYDDMKISDRAIINVLAVARKHGALIMIHAESTDCIAWLTERLLDAGHTAPKYHAESRPMLVEREATHRAITFAELVDVPILIVHVSGKEAIDQIRWAQNKGLKIYAETCPQYLFLSTEDFGGEDDYEASKCICSPPPRDPENQRFVWEALQAGTFSVFSSDHAPFNYEDPEGKQVAGKKPSFDKVPNGIPGLETRLPLLFSYGVTTNKITIEQFVQLTSTDVAKMYGLYPRKGSIAIGSDADLVIWDTLKKQVITNDKLHHAVDYTPYEGIDVNAWPAITINRGKVIWQDDKFYGVKGEGDFLRCDKPRPARPKVHSTPFRRSGG